jgi:hypothetical protein
MTMDDETRLLIETLLEIVNERLERLRDEMGVMWVAVERELEQLRQMATETQLEAINNSLVAAHYRSFLAGEMAKHGVGVAEYAKVLRAAKMVDEIDELTEGVNE